MTNEEFIKSISLKGEVWKDVPGYENMYIASTLGRLASLNRTITRKSDGAELKLQARLMQHSCGNWGYYQVTLCKNGKQYKDFIHRIIAFTFVNNPDNKPVVDHINGDKTDNRPDNLRWVTYKENSNNEVTRTKAKQIYCEKGRPIVCLKNRKLIKIYQYPAQTREDGFCLTNVLNVCKNIYSQHRGYQFMYYDEYNKLLEKDQSLN